MRLALETVLAYLLHFFVPFRGELTPKEQHACEVLLERLFVPSRKTHSPLMVALVGLPGSGKSSVSRELAGQIGGSVIEGDAIRVLLHKEGERYEGARKIGEYVASVVIREGGNVVLDSDHSAFQKRLMLRAKARKMRAKLVFARTYSDPDVTFGRMMATAYQNSPDDFFGGAGSAWRGNPALRGAVVKIREMWRRTPHHYRWTADGDGKWIIRWLPYVDADIDTTFDKWREEARRVAEKLLARY